MKKTFALLITLVLILSGLSPAKGSSNPVSLEAVESAFNCPAKPHPRLFMTDDQLTSVRARIESSPELKNLYNRIMHKADSILTKPPVERIKTGRHLLGVSRECLARTMLLSTAWRFTHEKKYLDRAEKEMLAAAAFTDWNPSHFLDVAEMTAALAIGYDWLYNDLSESSRKTIADAILSKGINPSLKTKGGNWWIAGKNNWNQVCHGGITLGALALMEDHPDIAKKIVHRAANFVQIAMKEYEPNGAYPEGPGYWVYGTSYNVMLIAALESVLSTDFGLSKMNGFADSAEYFLHITGPTDLFFNYPDSGSRSSLVPAVFWFANKYNDPSLTFNQHRYLKQALGKKTSSITESRLIPLALIWAAGKTETPTKLSWMGHGINPVAAFRTSWTDPDATYLAIKGGSPSAPHGHMDVGSFVIDSQGLRWAMDLGPESYNKIESLGMNLWNQSQGSDRWKILRYSNLSHNTLVVNGQLQQVTGRAPITDFSGEPLSRVTIDMTDVYSDQLTSAIRTASLQPNGTVTISDRLQANDKPASVRWAMVTPAKIEIKSDKLALLTQKGKTMTFKLDTNSKTRLTTYPTTPKADYDQPNPNTQMIGFEIKLSPNQAANLTVTICPSTK